MPPTGYSHSKLLTIDSSQVSGSHTDYPVLVNLDGDTTLCDTARADGYDIVFTADDGETILPHRRVEHVRLAVADGCRTWYGGPHAVRHVGIEDKTYFGYIDSSGSLWIGAYDHTSDSLDTPYEIASGLTVDDHIVPSILVRADGKIVVFWGFTTHSVALQCRISTNAEDISAFGSAITTGISGSYPDPVLFSNGTIRLYHRQEVSADRAHYYVDSSDGGATWGSSVQMFFNGVGTSYPYFKIANNGDVVHFFTTNSHPVLNSSNSIYHYKYDHSDGNYYKADNTLIGGSGALPLDAADCDLIHDGSSGGRTWTGDAAVDSAGHPVCLYYKYPTDYYKNIIVRYARWSGTAWADNQIVSSGAGIADSREQFYPGGGAIDPTDPDVVYVSANDTAGGRHIYMYETADDGATWGAATQISQDMGDKNIRPLVPINRHADLPVMWLYGYYTHYQNYETGIRFGGTAGETAGTEFRSEHYVKIPSLTSSADVDIYVYTGKSDATDQQHSLTDVFGSDTIAVARGDVHRATFGLLSSLAGASQLTAEFHARLDYNASVFNRFASNWDGTAKASVLLNDASGTATDVRGFIYTSAAVGGGFGGIALSTGGAWNRVEYLFTAGSTLRARRNGTQSATTFSGSNPLNSTPATVGLWIGQDSVSENSPFGGPFSFVRFSTVERSADYLNTARANENNLTTFVTGAAWEEVSGSAYTLTADPASLAITGTSANLLYNRRLTADPGTLPVSGTNATLGYNRILSAESGSVPITGTAATLTRGYRLTAESGSLGISGQSASLLYNRILTASPGSLPITGTDANLIYTQPGQYVLTANPGALPFSGTAAGLYYNRLLTAESGSLPISGTDAEFVYLRAYTLTAESGSVPIVGTAATLTYSGAVTAVPDDSCVAACVRRVFVSRANHMRDALTDSIIPVNPNGDSFTFGVDVTQWLPSGVTVSSVGTITQENDAGAGNPQAEVDEDDITAITVASVDKNAAAMTNHKDETVAINSGIQGTVSGGTHGVLYYVTIPVTLSDGQIFAVVQRFRCTKGYNL